MEINEVRQWIHEQGFLYSKMPEQTRIEEVLEHYSLYETVEDYPRHLKVFIDCSESTFDFKAKDIPKIWEAVGKCLDNYDTIEEAILVQQPYETAMAVIFENGAPTENYQFKIFSTREVALDWLNR